MLGLRRRHLTLPVLRGVAQLLSQRHLIPFEFLAGAPLATTFRLQITELSFYYKVDPGDLFGALLYWRGLAPFEPDTIPLFIEYARSAPRVVDAGAHTGIYSLLACAANPNLEVFCFEPNPATFQRLERNLALNDFSRRCTAIRAAVSSEQGTASLKTADDQTMCTLEGRSSPSAIEVAVTSLDSVLPLDAKTRLMKIDVEGHEDKVLQGAVKTIEASRPIIFFECNPGNRAQSIETLLRERDYSLFSLLNGKPKELSKLVPEDLPHGHHNFLARPR